MTCRVRCGRAHTPIGAFHGFHDKVYGRDIVEHPVGEGAAGRGVRVGLRTMVMGLDVVAAACVMDEAVCEFAEVEIYRQKGEWGARAATGTGTRISVGFDQDRFVAVLARC